MFFVKLVFKNWLLFFNLKTVFKNKFKKIWSNKFIYIYIYFLKLVKTISIYLLKIVLYFILFLKIKNKDETVLENFKNGFLFLKLKIVFKSHNQTNS